MAIPTYLWLRGNGQKVPLQLVDDDYLRNIYIRLKEVEFGNGSDVLVCGYREKSPMDKDFAMLWLPRIIEEAKRRNLTLPKIDKQTYHLDLKRRRDRRDNKQENNKKFDQNT